MIFLNVDDVDVVDDDDDVVVIGIYNMYFNEKKKKNPFEIRIRREVFHN